MSTAAHRVDNGPTVRITAGTFLALVTPSRLDRHRHRRPSQWEESLIPPILLTGFGLLLILTGVLWW